MPGSERRSRRGRGVTNGEGDSDPSQRPGNAEDPGDSTEQNPNRWDGQQPKDPEPKSPPNPPPRRARREPAPPDPVMSGLSTVMFFGLIAVAVGFVIWLIARNFMRGGDGAAAEGDTEPAGVEPDAVSSPAGPIETDVQRLLAKARQAAAAGDYERAIADAYAALLRRLDGDGLIELHRSATNGDYVRHLASNPQLRSQLKAIVRDVETVQFGNQRASAGLFERLFARILPLATQALAWLVILVSALTTMSCDLAPSQSGEAAMSKGSTEPSGSRALAEMLAENGVEVSYRAASLSELPTTPHTLILLRQPESKQWDELLAWVRNVGGHVVCAGVAPPEQLGMSPVWYSGDERRLSASSSNADSFGALNLMVPPNSNLRISGDRVDSVLLRGNEPYAATRPWGTGTITVFADDYLFTNIALLIGDNSEFMQGFLSVDREVEFCNEWTDAGAGSPLESVHRARLTPVVLQALALLALLFLFRGIAFGKPRDPRRQKRRAFADHVRALGLRYARARASDHVLGLYAAWALDRLRERFLRGARGGLSDLAEAIAVRTGLAANEVLRVLVDAQCARDGIGPPSYRPISVRDSRAAAAPAGQLATDNLAIMWQLARFLAVTSTSGPRLGSSQEK